MADRIITVEGAPFNYSAFVGALFAKRNTGPEGLQHATVGMTGEAGELLDAIKKVWVYGRERDRKNEVEELGDFEFYFEAGLQTLRAQDRPELSEVNHEIIAELVKKFDGSQIVAVSQLTAAAAGMLSLSTVMFDPLSEVEERKEAFGQIEEALSTVDAMLALTYSTLGIARDEALQANVAKLRVRYPQGYTDAAAIARADKREAA